MPISCRSDEEGDAAPPDPAFSTPTKVNRKAGAGHAESDAERMETDSEADVEKQLDKSTGRGKSKTKPRKSTGEKRPYAPFHQYREVGRWATGQDSVLEPAEIEHEICTLMKKFMQGSRLMQTPAHEQLPTDKALWKQQRAEYHIITTRELTK